MTSLETMQAASKARHARKRKRKKIPKPYKKRGAYVRKQPIAKIVDWDKIALAAIR